LDDSIFSQKRVLDVKVIGVVMDCTAVGSMHCIVKVGSSSFQTSKVIGSNPVWNADCSFTNFPKDINIMKIFIYEEDLLLGIAQLKIHEIIEMDNTEFSLEIIHSTHNNSCGTINIHAQINDENAGMLACLGLPFCDKFPIRVKPGDIVFFVAQNSNIPTLPTENRAGVIMPPTDESGELQLMYTTAAGCIGCEPLEDMLNVWIMQKPFEMVFRRLRNLSAEEAVQISLKLEQFYHNHQGKSYEVLKSHVYISEGGHWPHLFCFGVVAAVLTEIELVLQEKITSNYFTTSFLEKILLQKNFFGGVVTFNLPQN